MENSKPHETLITGMCLSLLGGFLDAYSYLLKGNVFANAQTGNLVLLFLAIADRQFAQIVNYFVPIVMFALGVLFSELLKDLRLLSETVRIQLVLIIESAVIITIAFAGNHFYDCVVNSVISFLAAVQVANFDRVNGSPVATTMITGNLKNSMVEFARYLHTGNRTNWSAFIRYCIIIVSFGFGVITGCVAIHLFGSYSILCCLIFTAVPFFLLRSFV